MLTLSFSFNNFIDMVNLTFIIMLILMVIIFALLWLVHCIKEPGVGYWRYLFNKLFSSKHNDCVCQYCKRTFPKRKAINHIYCSKRCAKWAYEDSRQKFSHNNRCQKHKFQRLTYRGQCFDCYIESWIKEHKILKRKETFSLIMFHGFRWIPTLRTSKDSWNGDKTAFDMMLNKMGYKWIVYIKFYVDKSGSIKPLVVGKSGSTKVNGSGCDLSFSVAVEDGNARKFLQQNGYSWYYDYILAKKFQKESDAYAFESKIMNSYNMHGS